MDAVVQLSDLTKPSTTGGAPAVDQASQVVAAAGAVAVEGPSDSGKPGYSGLVAEPWTAREATEDLVTQGWPRTGTGS
jgi:hypothetical protein